MRATQNWTPDRIAACAAHVQFIELRHNETGKRQLGVNLNGASASMLSGIRRAPIFRCSVMRDETHWFAGLQVLTGIDVVEEVGFATAYDEEIEFRLDTENWLLWITSVGK